MIDKLSPNECALCGSCADACPTGAISFDKEYLDFRYPVIDPDKCVSCGLCEKACPVLSLGAKAADTQEEHRVYAARNPDTDVRRSSSSGGVFWALAKNTLSCGGYVCGAVFDEEFHVRHMISNREEDVRKMMGSKYAQSDLTGVYKQVRELLRDGKQVLFTGCPCQVAGLRSFLGSDHENLLTADIICHGIPSGIMLRAHLDYLEKKYRSKIETLCFRDKKYGWHRSAVRIRFSNGAEYCIPYIADAYIKGFLNGTTLKESCFDCRFRNFRSGSDLTMGDFWGAEAVLPNLDDNIGLSAVIANSEKSITALQQCGLDLHAANLDTVIRYNRKLIDSTKRSSDRDAFYLYAQKNGYSAAIGKLLTESLPDKLRREGSYRLRCLRNYLLGRKKPLY